MKTEVLSKLIKRRRQKDMSLRCVLAMRKNS